MDAGTVPPGWTYSPSSWLQRLPIIALGFLGFLIAGRWTTRFGLWSPAEGPHYSCRPHQQRRVLLTTKRAFQLTQ